jgi:hypothetical protein
VPPHDSKEKRTRSCVGDCDISPGSGEKECASCRKLDRLSRDVLFISGLIAHKVPFVVARRAWMQIPSCCISAPRFAEKERSLISQQTRAALAAAKERGVVLGSAARHVARKRHRIQPVTPRGGTWAPMQVKNILDRSSG